MRDHLDSLRELLSPYVENVVLLDDIDSTHAMARRLIADMDEQEQTLGATLIAAARQGSGEGRGGRGWASPSGGLYLNWLRTGVDTETIQRIPMLAAAAVHAAVSSLGVAGARIKWPNDILVGDRKLAGLLVFARHGDINWVTVGLGVNVDTAPVLGDGHPVQPTSLAEELGGSAVGKLDDLIVRFVSALSLSLQEPAPALAVWRNELVQTVGDTVNVRLGSGKELTGSLVEITADGFLRLDVDGEEHTVTGGDIIEG